MHGILLLRGEGLVLLAEGLLDATSPHGEMLTRLWRDTCKHTCNPWQRSLKCHVRKQCTKPFAHRTKHTSIIMPKTKLKSYCCEKVASKATMENDRMETPRNKEDRRTEHHGTMQRFHSSCYKVEQVGYDPRIQTDS